MTNNVSHAEPQPAVVDALQHAGMPIAENQCRVISHRALNLEYRHLVLSAPPIALTATAGQFFHLRCPANGAEAALLRRPMSVYRVTGTTGTIEFLYKVQGLGTRGLAELMPGDRLDALGPLGHGFTLPPACRNPLMVARGVGLATLAPLSTLALSRGARITAVLSARSNETLMSVDYLRGLGADLVCVTDSDGSSEVGLLERRLRAMHAVQPFDYLATCGSNRLLQLVQRLCHDWQVPGEVALEQRMGCGMGMCYACVRPMRCTPVKPAVTVVPATSIEPAAAEPPRVTYRLVCSDGPVFDVREALSW